MNNKGQALVEFVLILPVFLFILLTIYDFGNLFNKKNQLEGKSNDIIDMYKNGKSLEELNVIYDDISISANLVDDYNEITIESSLEMTTPLLKHIFGNPCVIRIERYVPNVK